MAIGRAERMAERTPRIATSFDNAATETVVAVLTLTEMAWHDCYGEVSPPESLIDDILLCSEGDLATLILAAEQAVEDPRDVMEWAADIRGRAR